MAKENFDLVGGEEPARTGMQAVSETEMLGTCTHQVRSVFLAGDLTHVFEAVAIVAIRILVNGGIALPTGRDGHHGAFGNDRPVG